jgi:hypothetical protein
MPGAATAGEPGLALTTVLVLARDRPYPRRPPTVLFRFGSCRRLHLVTQPVGTLDGVNDSAVSASHLVTDTSGATSGLASVRFSACRFRFLLWFACRQPAFSSGHRHLRDFAIISVKRICGCRKAAAQL